MSYYDWQHLTKPWTIIPVEQDTIENTKALSITPVDDISIKYHTIVIPQFTFNIGNLMANHIVPSGNLSPSQLIGQYNYTAAGIFSLDNTDSIFDPQVAYCVRWRRTNDPTIGVDPTGAEDTVYRYVLGNIHDENFGMPMFPQWLPFPKYANQSISPNFVIEVWLKRVLYSSASIDAGGFNIQTGLIYFPTDYNDPPPMANPQQIVTLDTLLLPPFGSGEHVPTTVDPSGPWLPNP
jgi:hypothetical protein